MLPKLEGYATALLGDLDATSLTTVVGELESLDRAVLSQPDLRSLLSDTALTQVIRSSVLRDLLQGRLSDATVRLATYAVQAVAAQDVAHAFGELALTALVVSEVGAVNHAPLGLLAARQRLAGFADAGLEGVATNEFAAIEDDMFRWARTIESNEALRRVLVDRDAPLESRLGLVRQLLAGKVHPAALRLASYVVEGGRARDVVGSLDYLVIYVARLRDWRVARIHAARELDDESREALATALAALTGKSVELQISIDAALLSGVLVEVGDLRLDATTKGRLGALHDLVSSGRFYQSALQEND